MDDSNLVPLLVKFRDHVETEEIGKKTADLLEEIMAEIDARTDEVTESLQTSIELRMQAADSFRHAVWMYQGARFWFLGSLGVLVVALFVGGWWK